MWYKDLPVFYLTCLVFIVILCYLSSSRSHSSSCILQDSSDKNIDGFYHSINNQPYLVYEKIDYHPILTLPDIFSYQHYQHHQQQSSSTTPRRQRVQLIQTENKAWVVMVLSQSNGQQKSTIRFFHPQETEEKEVYYPPKDGWLIPPAGSSSGSGSSVSSTSTLAVVQCHGTPSSSTTTTGQSLSNLQQLLLAPVNTSIFLLLILIAYFLWEYRTEVQTVSFSYDAVVYRKEVWRVWTASLAHFDLMHLGFNTMALYQFYPLESLYGSLTYGYLSVLLIGLTILIVILMTHVLIHSYHYHQYSSQQSVGYSCVLFAWMVAVSVRQREYCPIFLFPSYCLPTYSIPFLDLPINLGPFVLVIFTSILIPRASFIGHLAGILIGYPLAWGWLTSITFFWSGSLFFIFCTIFYQHYEIIIWSRPSYDSVQTIQEILSLPVYRRYQLFQWISYLLLILLIPSFIYIHGANDCYLHILIRIVEIWAIWQGWYSRYLEVYSSSISSIATEMLVFSISFVALLALCDFASVNMIFWIGRDLIETQLLSSTYVISAGLLLVGMTLLELFWIVFAIRTMRDMSTGSIWLTTYHCDVDSIDKWMKWWMSWLPLGLFRATFPGAGRRLTPTDNSMRSHPDSQSYAASTTRDVSRQPTSPISNGAGPIGGKMGSNNSSGRAYMALPTSDPTEPDAYDGNGVV